MRNIAGPHPAVVPKEFTLVTVSVDRVDFLGNLYSD